MKSISASHQPTGHSLLAATFEFGEKCPRSAEVVHTFDRPFLSGLRPAAAWRQLRHPFVDRSCKSAKLCCIRKPTASMEGAASGRAQSVFRLAAAGRQGIAVRPWCLGRACAPGFLWGLRVFPLAAPSILFGFTEVYMGNSMPANTFGAFPDRRTDRRTARRATPRAESGPGLPPPGGRRGAQPVRWSVLGRAEGRPRGRGLAEPSWEWAAGLHRAAPRPGFRPGSHEAATQAVRGRRAAPGREERNGVPSPARAGLTRGGGGRKRKEGEGGAGHGVAHECAPLGAPPVHTHTCAGRAQYRPRGLAVGARSVRARVGAGRRVGASPGRGRGGKRRRTRGQGGWRWGLHASSRASRASAVACPRLCARADLASAAGGRQAVRRQAAAPPQSEAA